jgi:RNA polymerase subunit RPABC4/transcription elongation factor Spt4
MSFCGECGHEVAKEGKFCRACGSQLDPVARTKPEIQKQRNAKRQRSDCPVCESKDAVQNIGTIIDGGVINSAGSHGGLVGQFGSTQMGYYGGINLSTSQSALASRLTVPIPEATFAYGWLLLGVLFSAFYVFQWLTRDDFARDSWWIYAILSLGFGVIPGLPLGWILGAIAKKIEARKLVPFVNQASQATVYVRASFYCSRDDIAFGPDFAGNPELYIQKSIERFTQS